MNNAEARPGANPVSGDELPKVSIIVPMHNDAEWVEASIESAKAQTLRDIEVICIDDASTDSTREVVERVAATDERVRTIWLSENRSAFQARREGVLAARAPYVLFLDGDDELLPNAAERAYETAIGEAADVVEFRFEAYTADGHRMKKWGANRVRPSTPLTGPQIVKERVKAGTRPELGLWQFLFATRLLREAYESIPSNLMFWRANDVPITFLALSAAERYVPIEDELYRYYWKRGTSGQPAVTLDQVNFYARGVDSIEAIREVVLTRAEKWDEPEILLDSYDSVYLGMIHNVMAYIVRTSPAAIWKDAIALLEQRVSALSMLRSAALFEPAFIDVLARTLSNETPSRTHGKGVLISTVRLTVGGLQNVVAAQCDILIRLGYSVVVAVDSVDAESPALPDSVQIELVSGDSEYGRLESLLAIMTRHDIDTVIEHDVFYGKRWLRAALAGRAVGARTIGWLHSFAMRPILNRNGGLAFLRDRLGVFSKVVALSELDVQFWKAMGVSNVAFVPNPPSTFLSAMDPDVQPRTISGRSIRLVYWGRLDNHTKRLEQLVHVCEQLRLLGVVFTLAIVGPDSANYTASRLNAFIARKQLSEHITVQGAAQGPELDRILGRADLLLSTSILEGYQLTILEAQSRGLPVAMYTLPWLLSVQANDGIIATPQGDPKALAEAIRELTGDPLRYYEMSRASIVAARRALDLDLDGVYASLLGSDVLTEFSPSVSVEGLMQLLNLFQFYSEYAIAVGLSVENDHKRRISSLKSRVRELERSSGRSLFGRRRMASAKGASTPIATNWQGTHWTDRLVRSVTRPAARVLALAPWLGGFARLVERGLDGLRQRASSRPMSI